MAMMLHVELLGWIRRIYGLVMMAIPIVIISAYADLLDFHRITESGAAPS